MEHGRHLKNAPSGNAVNDFTSECRPIIAVVADVARRSRCRQASGPCSSRCRQASGPCRLAWLYAGAPNPGGSGYENFTALPFRASSRLHRLYQPLKFLMSPFFSLLPLLPPVPSFGCGPRPCWASSVAIELLHLAEVLLTIDNHRSNVGVKQLNTRSSDKRKTPPPHSRGTTGSTTLDA